MSFGCQVDNQYALIPLPNSNGGVRLFHLGARFCSLDPRRESAYHLVLGSKDSFSSLITHSSIGNEEASVTAIDSSAERER